MAQYYDKICNLCNKGKTFNEFSKRKNSKDGYRNSCKLCINKQKYNYYLKHKEYLDKKSKIWRDNNKDKLKDNVNKFHNNHPNYRREYQINNRAVISIRYKNRRDNDELFRLKENTRNLIKNSFLIGYTKKSKTQDILGCSFEEFKKHIETKFEVWMNWDNYGNPKDGILEPNKTWDIDHIIPLSSANNEEDIVRLNHYSNLQPLCSYTNRFIKKDYNGYIL